MKATEEDVHNEFAQADLDDPELIENEWRKEGRLPMIRESIVRANALRDVIAPRPRLPRSKKQGS